MRWDLHLTQKVYFVSVTQFLTANVQVVYFTVPKNLQGTYPEQLPVVGQITYTLHSNDACVTNIQQGCKISGKSTSKLYSPRSARSKACIYLEASSLVTPCRINSIIHSQFKQMDTLFTIDVLYLKNVARQKRQKRVVQRFPS